MMRTTPTLARQKLLELLRLTPEPHLLEGYVMVLRNAVDEYVRAIVRVLRYATQKRPLRVRESFRCTFPSVRVGGRDSLTPGGDLGPGWGLGRFPMGRWLDASSRPR